ncbi:unnamed protein product, partial [Mesorhabditis belari]|uniref:TPM domain-containing protein n=1 Tax=Mesorhabditis belari TaxID=2138241 RepID=A0AAF3J4H3_9BILA
MRSTSNVCDPNEIFSESERYRLNTALQTLATRSGGGKADFCDRKGIEAVLAVTDEGNQIFADELTKKWAIDVQCQKFVLFVYSSNDEKVYMSSQAKSGISADDFKLINDQYKNQLQNGDKAKLLAAMLKDIGNTKYGEERNTHPVHPGNSKTTNSLRNLFAVFIALILTFIFL